MPHLDRDKLERVEQYTLAQLYAETSNLVRVLRTSALRGKRGEVWLRSANMRASPGNAVDAKFPEMEGEMGCASALWN